MESLTMACDGHNLARRMWHVGEANKDEKRVLHAVFEFFAYLIRLNRAYAPAKVMMAWDCPPYFRSELYPAYKANRPDVEGNWPTQLHFIMKVAKEADIACVSKVGLEADDCLATIAAKSKNCLIVSSDKDLLSLVSDNDLLAKISGYTTVELLRWTEKEGTHRKRLSSRLDVKEFFGVFPEQVATYKALAGDASDNIPGITGIGHKKAVWLLEQYGTFQGVYDHLHCLTTTTGKQLKIASALEDEYDRAVLFREICQPVVDPDLILPEAKPLSVKAIARALESVPKDRR